MTTLSTITGLVRVMAVLAVLAVLGDRWIPAKRGLGRPVVRLSATRGPLTAPVAAVWPDRGTDPGPPRRRRPRDRPLCAQTGG